jgi:K+ transport systems, NAD-binding component
MPRQFAVIGLGNFGAQLAAELTRRGAEVLAIDEREEAVDDVRDHVTHTVRLDATDELALADQRIAEMDAVVVSFGSDFEAALLTVSVLKQIGAKRVIVRATTVRHERILETLGVDEVVLPVNETVTRLAGSLMVEGLYDSFALSSDYAVGEVAIPEELLGKKVGRWTSRPTTASRSSRSAGSSPRRGSSASGRGWSSGSSGSPRPRRRSSAETP